VSADPDEELKELDATLVSIEKVTDISRLRAELEELTAQASAPDLWDDQERAQALGGRISALTGEIERVNALRRRLDDTRVLLELARGESDEDSLAEVTAELVALRSAISALEVRTLLSGPYDARQAIITINPGAGGVDSQDWAQMLLRMYTRYSERHGEPAQVLDVQWAEEAGIKSAILRFTGAYAYGTLSGEHGVHRLVRISPFDNQSRRQTSFAAVDVTPVVEASDHVDIDDKDIRVDVFRSSGPGGQGVNTTDSAVRITHLPTGIVVSCQNERSQIQNRAAAMLVLQAKLLERRRQEALAEMDRIRGGRQDIAFGSQIRNYVLHPYQMVKDLRTDVETGNTGAVLDGEIDEFIEAEIRWRRAQGPDA
jgi:peptide chain release factor 2